ncbi:hypothetical protein TELCIR_16305 [Teladorsagia circumcincta]|uniref:Uncharacterized protein n=1 Tax=Teladorsagia circumcincta TaxID=45464 RepID=A0A2G9TVU8_TELCI|nr:hypothetical protein TELCIR_16305 [Teladorsagia circumcincta]
MVVDRNRRRSESVMPELGVSEVKKSPTPPLNDRGLFEPFEKDGKRVTEILRISALSEQLDSSVAQPDHMRGVAQ